MSSTLLYRFRVGIIATVGSGSNLGGHAGYYRTLYRVRQQFHWVGMTRFIKDFVAGCTTCQQVKIPPAKPLGLLHPLDIPTAIWENISLDFITVLPTVRGHSVIIVVVDRLSKYCHLGSLPATYSAASVAEYFVKQIIRLHGVPKKIVSDRDKIFLSRFWQEVFTRSGTTLGMSTTYHPKSDGQTEVVNKTIEIYLRAMIHNNPRNWVELLPWAEHWYNTSFHHSTGSSPFEIVYGRSPPALNPYSSGDSMVEAVDQELQRRQLIIKELRGNLLSAQERMKLNADRKRKQLEFEVGD